MTQDFEFIYLNGKPDCLICKHCMERVETGIANVAHHYMNCEKRTDGLIYTKNKMEEKIMDSLSINNKN